MNDVDLLLKALDRFDYESLHESRTFMAGIDAKNNVGAGLAFWACGFDSLPATICYCIVTQALSRLHGSRARPGSCAP